MNEDELTAALIENFDGRTAPEVSYNYYGDRGVVDLYRDSDLGDYIYEIKSDSAVKTSTGANEIIRQFNRHCEYFYPGTNYSPSESVTFELTFIPTERTVRHVFDNDSLYQEAIRNAVPTMSRWVSASAMLTFRHPQKTGPVLLFKNGTDIRNISDYGGYSETNRYVYDAMEAAGVFENV